MKRRTAMALLGLCTILLMTACSSSEDDKAIGGGADDDDAADDDDTIESDDDMSDDDAPPASALERFMPIVVQRLAEDYDALPYPEESDRMGEAYLTFGDEQIPYWVFADTNSPMVYTTQRTVFLGTTEHTQLIYAYFYPERPNPYTMETDPLNYLLTLFEEGPIDGKVIRVTLDENEETALLIEVSRNCGCDWKLYVNSLVDDAARVEVEANGGTYKGLVKADAPHDTQYVWVMPENVKDARTNIVIAAEEGWTDYPHKLIGAYTSDQQWADSGVAVDRGVVYAPGTRTETLGAFDGFPLETYATRAYETLYALSPDGIESVGIFDERGYVWNAYPFWGCWNCWGPNVEFPGTPRDLEDLEVVHETMDYWDQQTLLERFITLPASLF